MRIASVHLLGATLLVASVAAAPAQPPGDAIPVEATHAYAARFACGPADEALQQGAVEGTYETSVRISNAGAGPVRFEKLVSRGLPFQQAEPLGEPVRDTLPPQRSILIECDEIRTLLPLPLAAQLRDGVLVVRSDGPLEVSVTLTARPQAEAPVTADTVRVPERPLVCEPGFGGPDCSIACPAGQACDIDLFYNANGTVNGAIARGTLLTDTMDASDADAVLSDFRQWVREHTALLGLAEMDEGVLDGLVPDGSAPVSDGALVTHRFRQDYRGFPVVGPESVVSVTAGDFRGVLSFAGTVLDPRIEYLGLAAPLPEAAARQSMLEWHRELSGSEAAEAALTLEDVELVAVPQRQTMAWRGRILEGGLAVASIVVSAAVDDGGRAPRMAYRPLLEDLEDEQQISVRVEDMATADDPATSNADPVTTTDATELVAVPPIAGQPLLGSSFTPPDCIADPAGPQCGERRLGNTAVVTVDAQGGPLNGEDADLVVSTAPNGQFHASPGTDGFAAQDQFYKLLNALRLFDAPMLNAGRWETEDTTSSFPAGTYSPRILFVYNAPDVCRDQPACAGGFVHIDASAAELDLTPHEPPGGGAPEPYALLLSRSNVRTVMFHEFGHTLDSLVAREVIGTGVVGSGCQANGDCLPSCVLDTPDESLALAETVADLAQVYLIDRLYPQIPYERCGVLGIVSNAGGLVHHPDCIEAASEIEQFADTRTTEPGFNEVEGEEGTEFEPTGLCNHSPGYRQNPIYQAWWKFTHNRECLAEAPFTCSEGVPGTGETEEFFADIAMQAYLYAMRQSNAQSYEMFFSNMALFLDCRHGEEIGGFFRRVFDQHGIIANEGPPLVCPAICGDSVAEDAEQCDAPDLAGASCTSIGGGFTGGSLGCSPQCTFDTADCTTCGNGVLEQGEACDGNDFGGESCIGLGFAGGALACSASCDIDTGGCIDEPEPPENCTPGDEDCICQATFGQLGQEEAHPDGDHSVGEFCPDDGEIERTCVSQGSFGLCTTCSEGDDRHVGCSCTSDDQCGAGLSCWGEDTQNDSGTGHCYPQDDGPPSWQCIADCQALFNSEEAFCHNEHPSGDALCMDGACNAPQAFQCWTEGELEGIDDQPTFGPVCRFAPDDSPLSAACRSECGPGADPDNPGLDVTCQSLGYPEVYECDLQVAGGACRPGPL